MISLRRWLYRPKRSDSSLLAQFYFADEELNQVAAELDSFEGRKDPERCTALVNQLRACQARVLNVVSQMMDETVKDQRTPRDFRVKFPDDVIQENLAGQLWFGAECLAAGSSIMNREMESASMRPLARALTKNLDSLRTILRDQCLRNVHEYTETIKESLIIFDKLFAEFELRYVSAMVPVKTAHEYDMIQEITVLFSETVQRALKLGLLTKDMIDEYDPALMFTIPRLAIVSGVLVFKDGPLNPDNDPWNISDMFRPFQTLLLKIRELLSILTEEELMTLERALCSQEEPSYLISLEEKKKLSAREERRKSREEKKMKGPTGKKKKKDESDDGSVESELTALEIAERLEALALSFEASRNAKHTQTNEQQDPDTQSKMSETSSSSSVSLLSDADSEEMANAEAPKDSESGSDDCGDMQLQRFTNQLYYEANLDSHNLTQGVSILEPVNAFPAEEIFTNSPAANSDGDKDADNIGSKSESVAPQPCGAQEDGVESPDTELASAGRAHFAMSKCDSSDSGLHSEVLSNSGSLFTISSSDSNQHLGNPDIPVTTESNLDHPQPSLCDGLCVQRFSSVDVTFMPQTVGETESVQIDSRDSSNTLIPESEPNCDDKLCLDSLSSCEKECQGRSADADNKCDGMASQTDEGNEMVDSSKNSPSPPPTDCHAATVEATACTASGIGPDISSSKYAQDCKTQPLTHTNDTFEDSHGEVRTTGSEVAGELKSHIWEEESDTNVFQIHGHSSSESGDIQANKGAPQPESSGVAPTSDDNPPIVQDSVCDNLVGEKAGDSCTQLDNNHVSNQEATASVTQISAVDSHANTKISPTSPTAFEENKDCNDLKENNECIHQNEMTTFCHAPCDKTTSETDFAVKSNMSVAGDSSSASPAPTQTLESVPIEASSMPCTPSHATSTTEQTDQGKQMNLQTTTTQNELLHHSSAASMSSSSPTRPTSSSSPTRPTSSSSPTRPTSSSSPIRPSAATSKSNHKGAKGCSKAKERSKKSSKTSATDSRIRQPKDSKSSLPGQAKSLMESHLLDTDCYHSSETSSYTSDCADQEEIALAIKAAESATRHQVRARFRSSSDMIHRLFVCISGVADQLQTNFAGDLRNILRAVFDMNCSEPMDISEGDKCKDTTPLGAAYRAMSQASRNARRSRNSSNQRQDPPTWIPDDQSNECMSCQVPFTFVRRRHHCRNCGKIFCSRCSSNFVPLPHFGQDRAVRVCNRCFMFRVTPFTVQPSTSQ